jgi:siroheme synthase-like protein
MSHAVATPPLSVALCLADRRVVMVGGGPEAADKLPKLRAAGARVEIVAEAVAEAARAGHLRWWARTLRPSDLHGADVVVLVDIDPRQAAELRRLKGRYGYLLAAVDQPEVSDFYFVSIVARGPLQIGISTGGSAPLLARVLRQALEAGLDARFSRFVAQMVALRAQLRSLPKGERVRRLGEAFSGFALELRLRYPEGHPEQSQPHEATDP